MQNLDCYIELNRVNGTIGAVRIIFQKFKYAGSGEAFQCFC